jgi:TctA family transporter
MKAMMENAFRQSLIIYQKSFYIFFMRPISLILIMIAIFLLIYPILKKGKGIPLAGVGDIEGA